MGKGYSYSCDYWSTGIILFYCYYNYFPFGPRAKEPMDIYKETVRKELELPKPNNQNDVIINKIIKDLLKKKTRDRICTLARAKKYEIFSSFNSRSIVPIPVLAQKYQAN